jgi:putative membrane protein
MKLRTLAAASAPLALALGLSACAAKADNSSTTTDNTTVVTDNTMTSAGGDANAMDAVNPALTAQQFVDTAAKSDAFEIASAKLAQANASSADVKAFAAKMITDHTASTAKIKAAAAKSTPAVTPDPTLTDAQNSMLADLGKLKGADFDKQYISGQVDAHEQALTLMKNYADAGDSAPLKAAAGEIAPIVQGHLDMVKGMEGK